MNKDFEFGLELGIKRTLCPLEAPIFCLAALYQKKVKVDWEAFHGRPEEPGELNQDL